MQEKLWLLFAAMLAVAQYDQREETVNQIRTPTYNKIRTAIFCTLQPGKFVDRLEQEIKPTTNPKKSPKIMIEWILKIRRSMRFAEAAFDDKNHQRLLRET